MDTIDLGPQQDPITPQRVLDMITWRPRRMQLSTEWQEPLHEPSSEDKDWGLVLPFCETFRNAFNSMYDVKSIGLRHSRDRLRCYTFLKDVKEKPESLARVRNWVNTIGQYVTVRDCLALSFALDYNHKGGDPNKPKTRIGALVVRAKPYDNQPTSDTYVAADELVEEYGSRTGFTSSRPMERATGSEQLKEEQKGRHQNNLSLVERPSPSVCLQN